MKKYLLPDNCGSYKANLHCHSTLSDGRYDVGKLKQLYRERGYSIVAFSDHDRLIPHPELFSDDFIPMTAVEHGINEHGTECCYHLNFISEDKDRDVFPPFDRDYSVDGVNKLIAAANEAGFICQYNHPRWSFQSAENYRDLKGLWAFEVFNTGCEIEMHDGWGDREYEIICRDGKEYPAAVATDDNHNVAGDPGSPYDDSFGGWTTVFSPELSYEAVFSALKRGDCYATTGPEIYSMYVEDNKLHAKFSPACSVCLRFETRRTGVLHTHGDDMTEAVFDVSGPYRYFRLEVKDTHNNKAMTRAYTFEEING
ncbi:MAG: hypothetical protein J6330_10515 [Clostridia bacterium]|nr:hypothetical protein [Clostridia bacterium]